MWEMVGGVFAIAAPDTTGRQSRFLFSPILSSSEASLEEIFLSFYDGVPAQ